MGSKRKAARGEAAIFALYIQDIKLDGWWGQIREKYNSSGMMDLKGKVVIWGLDKVFPELGFGGDFTTKTQRHDGVLVGRRYLANYFRFDQLFDSTAAIRSATFIDA
jgi:hypothetical protein